MAKDKEKGGYAASIKAENRKTINKSRQKQTSATLQKLARRDTAKLQQQIAQLEAAKEARKGEAKPREREQLDRLQKELASVLKARKDTGYVDRNGENPSSRDSRPDAVEENKKKRKHDTDLPATEDESDATDPDVADIPMPRDTPPPVADHVLKRLRERKARLDPRGAYQASYESKAAVRDLRKEAVQFVPTSVARAAAQSRSGGVKDLDAAGQPQTIDQKTKDGLKQEMLRDAAEFAAEAEKEAELELLMKEADGGTLTQETVDRELRRVEIEDIEDDGN